MNKILVAAASLGAVLLVGVACGGGDGGEKQSVVDSITKAFNAWNAGDLEGYLAAVTEDFLSDSYGFRATKEGVRSGFQSGNVRPGDPPSEVGGIQKVRVSGDSATLEITAGLAHGVQSSRYSLVRQADTWLLDGLEVLRVQTPENATEAQVQLVDFQFRLSEEAFPPGDVAFQATNEGTLPHKMYVLKLPEGVSIEQAFEPEDPAEVGAELTAEFLPVYPGNSGTWVLRDLEPGRYGYYCFVPDRTGTPHAFKGMVGEFTVQ